MWKTVGCTRSCCGQCVWRRGCPVENKFARKPRFDRCEGRRPRAKSFLRSSRNNYPRNFSVVEVVCGAAISWGNDRGVDLPSSSLRIELEALAPPVAGKNVAASNKGVGAPCSLTLRNQRPQWRPVVASSKGAIPRGASSRRTEDTSLHHQDLVLRGAGYRGRSVPQGTRSSRTCGATARRSRVRRVPTSCESGAATSGVRETASRGSRRFTLSRKRTCQLASSTRPLPTSVRHVSRKGQRARVCSQPRTLATDRRRDAPPVVDEGVARLGVPHRTSRRARKQLGEVAVRRRAGVSRETMTACEDSRVRECDLIKVLCCIAPAVPSDRHRRKGRRHPGPG